MQPALLRKDSHRVGPDILETQIDPEHASLASRQVYTHPTGTEVAKHILEKMGEFFQMKSIKAESANSHGTAPAPYGTVEI